MRQNTSPRPLFLLFSPGECTLHLLISERAPSASTRAAAELLLGCLLSARAWLIITAVTHPAPCCWSAIKGIDSTNNRSIKPNDGASLSPAQVLLVSRERSLSLWQLSLLGGISCPAPQGKGSLGLLWDVTAPV